MKFCPLPLITLLVCSLLLPPFSDSALFSPAQQQMLKKGLLHRLGLTEVPGPMAPSLPVPDHMWRHYRDVTEDENDADFIRQFYPSKLIEENSGLLLSYNLSLAVQEETIRSAELKLKLGRRRRSRQSSSRRWMPEQTNQRSINLFVLPSNGQDRRLLDSRPIDSASSPAEYFTVDFDVSQAFHPWSQAGQMLYLFLELPPDVELYENPTSSLSSLPFFKKQSSPLVVQTHLSDPSTVRRKRNVRSGRRKNRKQHRTAQESGLCQKKELYVDFEELNWQDWILAPKGYEAGQCSGSCPHPLPAHLNATNHAIIQSLLHSINPQVPAPCCVPTETKPLAILYMDIDNRIVIKNYQDMRVEACGCG